MAIQEPFNISCPYGVFNPLDSFLPERRMHNLWKKLRRKDFVGSIF
jgi:hypothetical protein